MTKMIVTVNDRDKSRSLEERLRERLERTAELRCPVHNRPVTAVSIHARENGWFDPTWTTCCDLLQQQAAAILKERY